MSCCDAVYELDPEVERRCFTAKQADIKSSDRDGWFRRGAAGAITTAEPIRPGKNAEIADLRQKRILSTVLNAAGDCDGRLCADGRRRENGIHN